jgi:hypothetical protein
MYHVDDAYVQRGTYIMHANIHSSCMCSHAAMRMHACLCFWILIYMYMQRCCNLIPEISTSADTYNHAYGSVCTEMLRSDSWNIYICRHMQSCLWTDKYIFVYAETLQSSSWNIYTCRQHMQSCLWIDISVYAYTCNRAYGSIYLYTQMHACRLLGGARGTLSWRIGSPRVGWAVDWNSKPRPDEADCCCLHVVGLISLSIFSSLPSLLLQMQSAVLFTPGSTTCSPPLSGFWQSNCPHDQKSSTACTHVGHIYTDRSVGPYGTNKYRPCINLSIWFA